LFESIHPPAMMPLSLMASALVEVLFATGVMGVRLVTVAAWAQTTDPSSSPATADALSIE
jgi:hypothetical protein